MKKSRIQNLMEAHNVPLKCISNRTDLINWSKLVNTTRMDDHGMVTVLQDVYAHTSVKDMESFIKEIHDNNRNELQHFFFCVGKMMGSDTQYDTIKLIGIKIANDEINKVIEERTKFIDDREMKFLKDENDLIQKIKVNDQAIKNMSTKLKSKEDEVHRRNIKIQNLDAEIESLEQENSDLKPDADNWKNFKYYFIKLIEVNK